VPVIPITSREIECTHSRSYSECLHLPSDQTSQHRAPLLRPLYGPIISRKSLVHSFPSISLGPVAYRMHEFDEDILLRPQPGVTQRHRFIIRSTNTYIKNKSTFLLSE